MDRLGGGVKRREKGKEMTNVTRTARRRKNTSNKETAKGGKKKDVRFTG